MAKTDREKAPLLLRRTLHGLVAVDAVDGERLAAITMGSDVEVTIKQRRSLPQLRLYWKMLGEVVKATDCAPSAEHLHDMIKLDLGYVTRLKTFRGMTVEIPDSTAFASMEPHEFSIFFERAIRHIAERCGIDPMQGYYDELDKKAKAAA